MTLGQVLGRPKNWSHIWPLRLSPRGGRPASMAALIRGNAEVQRIYETSFLTPQSLLVRLSENSRNSRRHAPGHVCVRSSEFVLPLENHSNFQAETGGRFQRRAACPFHTPVTELGRSAGEIQIGISNTYPVSPAEFLQKKWPARCNNPLGNSASSAKNPIPLGNEWITRRSFSCCGRHY